MNKDKNYFQKCTEKGRRYYQKNRKATKNGM